MKLGAVIVTYHPVLNSIQLLLNNITQSVEKVIVVDNDSINIDEIETLLEDNVQVELIKLNTNTGIGFAQNRGIERLLADTQIDGIILFDHDSQPEPQMINSLTAAYIKLKETPNARVGAVGPVYVDPRTKNFYPVVFHKGITLKKYYPKPGNNDPIITTVLIASGCLIPRVTLELVGLMNEDFFIDYVDIEWSFRVQRNGYKLYAIPDAFMYHQVGDGRLKVLGREISIHSPVRRYYLARNSILMLKTRYINKSYKVREAFYTVSRVAVYLLLVKSKRKYLWYILNGWYDGLRGKVGPSGFIQKQKR